MERDVREMLEAAFAQMYGLTLAARDWDALNWAPANRFRRFLDAEAYTDAALMLVPEGWRFRLMSSDFEGFLAEVWNDGVDDCEFADRGPIPALAIAQAAIKARENGDG